MYELPDERDVLLDDPTELLRELLPLLYELPDERDVLLDDPTELLRELLPLLYELPDERDVLLDDPTELPPREVPPLDTPLPPETAEERDAPELVPETAEEREEPPRPRTVPLEVLLPEDTEPWLPPDGARLMKLPPAEPPARGVRDIPELEGPVM